MLNNLTKQELLHAIAWCWINNPTWIVEAMAIAFKLVSPPKEKLN